LIALLRHNKLVVANVG